MIDCSFLRSLKQASIFEELDKLGAAHLIGIHRLSKGTVVREDADEKRAMMVHDFLQLFESLFSGRLLDDLLFLVIHSLLAEAE